jgi:hypothetical protein
MLRNVNTKKDVDLSLNMEFTFDQFLESHCSLTSAQITAVKLRKQVERGDMSPREAVVSRGKKSAGSYYRVLSQAKANVTQSVFTILLASRLGITSLDDFQRLLTLVSKLPSEPAPPELEDVNALVEALVKRLVML